MCLRGVSEGEEEREKYKAKGAHKKKKHTPKLGGSSSKGEEDHGGGGKANGPGRKSRGRTKTITTRRTHLRVEERGPRAEKS